MTTATIRPKLWLRNFLAFGLLNLFLSNLIYVSYVCYVDLYGDETEALIALFSVLELLGLCSGIPVFSSNIRSICVICFGYFVNYSYHLDYLQRKDDWNFPSRRKMRHTLKLDLLYKSLYDALYGYSTFVLCLWIFCLFVQWLLELPKRNLQRICAYLAHLNDR